MDKRKLMAYLAVLGYALIIGFTFLFSKEAMVYDVSIQLAYRGIIAAIPVIIYAIVQRGSLHYTKDKITKLLLLGLLFPFLFVGIQTFGLSITSSLEAGVAQAMAPILTLIFASLFLGETTNYKQKLSIVLSVAGVIYIIYRKQVKNPDPDFTGMAVLFLATISFSIYSVAVRRLKGFCTNREILTVVLTESAIMFFGIALVKYGKRGELHRLVEPIHDPSFIKDVLYLGLLSTFSSGLLLNYALQILPASNVVIFNNLATVIQIISGAFILGEPLFFSHKVGSVCIVLGVLGLNFLGEKNPPEPDTIKSRE
ncbi:MAG: DMT family transporter [Tissierellia bacterium]|nr:DMT family transporter [Tissierellia bacterium]